MLACHRGSLFLTSSIAPHARRGRGNAVGSRFRRALLDGQDEVERNHGFHKTNAAPKVTPNECFVKFLAIPLWRVDKINHVVAHSWFVGIYNSVRRRQLLHGVEGHRAFKITACDKTIFQLASDWIGALVNSIHSAHDHATVLKGAGVEMGIKMRGSVVRTAGGTMSKGIPVQKHKSVGKVHSGIVGKVRKFHGQFVSTAGNDNVSIGVCRGPIVV
mmetsp:Transcript_6705/g.17246  ORF Transcript_6705/g.17246 Transcript_6705/m.17246 type:complete len:216 (+) Transcript_6705:44-691(+)